VAGLALCPIRWQWARDTSVRRRVSSLTAGRQEEAAPTQYSRHVAEVLGAMFAQTMDWPVGLNPMFT
jgi:hypothetical protein